ERCGGDDRTVFEVTEGFTPNAAQLAQYAGAYVSEEIDPVYRISADGEKLTLARLKHSPDILRPLVRDVFTGRIGTVRFIRDQATGNVSGFALNSGRVQNFHFAKKPN